MRLVPPLSSGADHEHRFDGRVHQAVPPTAAIMRSAPCLSRPLTYEMDHGACVRHDGAIPLAPTKLTFVHADDAGAEGRVPASRLCVSGQRDRVVGHPQDVDPLEGRLGDRVASGVRRLRQCLHINRGMS